MRETVELLLEKGDFAALQEVVLPMDMEAIDSLLFQIAYDEDCIAAYSFANYMIQITNSPEWHRVAKNLMVHQFFYLGGAYSVALFHLREILKVRRTVDNLRGLLFFNSVPEKVVDDEEARLVAEEILREVPDDPVALRILRETSSET